MFSGGLPLPPAASTPPPTTAQEAGEARQAVSEEGEHVADLNQAQGEARNGVEDASQTMSHARNERGNVEQDANYNERLEKDKRQSMEQSIEQLQQYARQMENEMLRTNADEERMLELFDRARFERHMFEKAVKSTVDEACGELYAEAQSAWAEVVRLFMAHTSNMGRAMMADLVGRISASLQFNSLSLFRPRTAPDDRSKDYHASAVGAQRNLEAQRANIMQRAANNPNEKLVEKRKADYEDAAAKDKVSQAELANAKGAEAAAEQAHRGARDVYNAKQNEHQRANNQMNAMQRSLYTYSDIKSQEDRERAEEAARQREQQA